MDVVTLGQARAQGHRLFQHKRPRIVLPFGDSITYLDVGFLSEAPASLRTPATAYQVGGSQATGMFAWSNFFLGGAFRYVGNAGVPGDTTTMMLARIDAMLAISSDVVAVQGGANDWTAGVTAGQTGDQIAAGTIANLGTIYSKIRSAGKTLLALTTHSRSTMNSTDGHKYLSKVNRWISDYARTTPGVLFADTCSVITDPATGVPYSPWRGTTYQTSDGTHPNGVGAMQQGQRIAAALAPLATPINVFSTVGNTDPYNFSRNPAGTGSAGTTANGITGTPATQMTITTGSGTGVAAVSKVARVDDEQGEWTRIVVGPGNTAQILVSIATLWDDTGVNGVKVGDKVLTAIEVRTSGLQGVTEFKAGVFNPSTAAYALNGTYQQAGSGVAIPGGVGVFVVEGFTIGGGSALSQRVALNATSGILDIGRTAVLK